MIWRAPRLWNTSRKKATPTVGNTFQTENYSINYQHLKTYHYEDEQKSTEEQRTEIRERKCSKSNCFGSYPEADNVTHTAGRAHGYRSDGPPRNGNRSTVTEETPQQVTFKTPLATATAETDLDITTIHPSTDNHRKTFNDASLQELAESIREVGILQAIAVRPRTEGGYEIIYGERRYRASLLAGAKTIKATIYNNVTDDEAEDMSLSENLQREQVRPTEEAKAFKRLLEKGRYDMYSLTARFGRSEKYIYTD